MPAHLLDLIHCRVGHAACLIEKARKMNDLEHVRLDMEHWLGQIYRLLVDLGWEIGLEWIECPEPARPARKIVEIQREKNYVNPR